MPKVTCSEIYTLDFLGNDKNKLNQKEKKRFKGEVSLNLPMVDQGRRLPFYKIVNFPQLIDHNL